jgi:superfamily II DNA or RNA helicase
MGLQTVVTVYRVSHLAQWKDSIRTVNPALRVQILENKTEVEPGMDFYLILGDNMSNRTYTEFTGVGMFIVDECHMFCTPRMSKAFLRVQPKYCLALSATPFRSDQLDKILQVHFGYSIIRRKLFRPFNVYKYETKLKPETRETEQGQLDWAHVITSQANRPERNAIIVKLCQFFRNRTIMILTKRVEQHGSLLKDMLEQAGESVDMFAGMAQTYNKDARILVATYSKAGVGFDNPKLDMLIVAGDVEEMFEQYLGRVFRRMDTVPIIIDMVDNFHVFEKHFQTRMLTYLQSGGLIKPFQTHFPEFYSTFDVLFRRGIRIVQKEPTPPKEKPTEDKKEKSVEKPLRVKKEVSPSRKELLPENLNPLHKPILPQFVQSAKAKKKNPKVKEKKNPKEQKNLQVKEQKNLQVKEEQKDKPNPKDKTDPLQKDKMTVSIPKKTLVKVLLPPTVPTEPLVTILSEQVPLPLQIPPHEVLPI